MLNIRHEHTLNDRSLESTVAANESLMTENQQADMPALVQLSSEDDTCSSSGTADENLMQYPVKKKNKNKKRRKNT